MYTVIDLSKNNGPLNAEVLKKNVDGVILRIGYRGYSYGNLVTDNMFENYASACVNAGIPLAFYFFPTDISDSEAINSAIFAYNLASKYVKKPLIYADSEIADVTNKKGRSDKLSKTNRTKFLVTFCEKIKELGGTPGVYASDSWFKNNLDLTKLSSYSLWVAKYSCVAPVNVSNYDAWQYTSKALVNGIAKKENDLSYFYKSFTEIGTKNTNPYPVPTRTLKRQAIMMHGDDVKWVQYNVGCKADGWFGKDTEAKVKEYQLMHGLDVDGIVGMNTRAEMLKTWK